MMVLLVSECEKKALPRTRRVLDAFADRIGSNTWRTVITQDGLIAVKKLLRKTASKSTAVSCHIIPANSRSRMELLWIVGNRRKFNAEGIVAVNWTEQEVFMDVKPTKLEDKIAYANTHGQPLAEHLFAVAYVAQCLYERLFDQGKLGQPIFIAGALHDIGKLDPHFQAWLRKKNGQMIEVEDGQHIDDNKFSFDQHPRHNEISVLMYQLFDHIQIKTLHKDNKASIKHTVLWHHAKPYRKTGDYSRYQDIYDKLTKNLKGVSFEQFYSQTQDLIKSVAALADQYGTATHRLIESIDTAFDADYVDDRLDKPLPAYKSYTAQSQIADYQADSQINAINNIIRACVITADRLVSKQSQADLSSLVERKKLDTLLDEPFDHSSNLASEIAECLSSFTDLSRNQKQHEIAQKLAADAIEDDQNGVRVLAGAAGCGKTKIALEWAQLSKAQKIIWVCPRVQVCQGIFDELRSDRYLPHSSIEIFTGEFKYSNDWDTPTDEDHYFSADIVITTIDQLLNSIITHSKIDSLIEFLHAHVVFDEYHEYINQPAFNLLFAELVHCKDLQQRKNALLVSATPHYGYLEQLLGVSADQIAIMPSFNQSSYRIEFVDYDDKACDSSNPLFAPHDQKTFVISNTAKTAQQSFLRNPEEASLLFHARFKRSDKQRLFETVFNCFKQDGDHSHLVLRSGPIVQASLNISCDYMVSEMTTAENTLQRLGRLNRFGENPEQVYTLTLAVTDGIKRGKSVDSSSRFAGSKNELQSSRAWYDWLSGELGDKPLKLSEIYQIYQKFHRHPAAVALIESDLLDAFGRSVQVINHKVIDPIVIKKPKAESDGIQRMSKHSLRGNSVFVQMVLCDVSQFPQISMLNEYACAESSDDRQSPDFITESLETLSNSGLLDYAAQKHGRIDKAHPMAGIAAKQMNLRKRVAEGAARSTEFPIYTSYIQEHLEVIGEALYEHSIVYAVSHKQVIGSIAYYDLLGKRQDADGE